jgi:hypothetical protein
MQIVQNAIFTNANDDFMQLDSNNQRYNSNSQNLRLYPSLAYKFTKPRNLPLMPMLRKRKFELTNEPTTFASIAITQTIKSKIALPSNRMTIVGATRILTCKSATSKQPFNISDILNPSSPNTDTVISISAKSKTEQILQA